MAMRVHSWGCETALAICGWEIYFVVIGGFCWIFAGLDVKAFSRRLVLCHSSPYFTHAHFLLLFSLTWKKYLYGYLNLIGHHV
jgi:hypothetical protein